MRRLTHVNLRVEHARALHVIGYANDRNPFRVRAQMPALLAVMSIANVRLGSRVSS